MSDPMDEAVAAARKWYRNQGALTVGELIELLSRHNPEDIVESDQGDHNIQFYGVRDEQPIRGSVFIE